MIQPFIDAATSIPVWVWCALIVAGTAIGFCALLVAKTLAEDARLDPSSGRRHGDPGPEESLWSHAAPGPGLPFHRRIQHEWRRHQSWRRARERELGIRDGRLQ